VWGRLFETHAVKKLRAGYAPVLESFSVDMGKNGQIDFLAVADGYEAWEGFAKDHMAHMGNSTRETLHGPHFLIAEIGLTTQTLVKKFKDNATSLRLMQKFVSTMRSKDFSAVKCLVYDGADAEDFAKSKIAGQFLGEGGILINIPYLSAETILAKLNETTKLREELQALRGDLKLSGTTAALTEAVWVRQLQKDGAGDFNFAGNAFKVIGAATDIDELKKAINPSLPPIEASKIDIYLQQEDGSWNKQDEEAALERGASKSDCYGFLLP